MSTLSQNTFSSIYHMMDLYANKLWKRKYSKHVHKVYIYAVNRKPIPNIPREKWQEHIRCMPKDKQFEEAVNMKKYFDERKEDLELYIYRINVMYKESGMRKLGKEEIEGITTRDIVRLTNDNEDVLKAKFKHTLIIEYDPKTDEMSMFDNVVNVTPEGEELSLQNT